MLNYGESEVFESAGPVGAAPLPAEFATEIGIRHIPKPFIAAITDVDLLGPWGLAVAPGTRYVLEQAEGSVGRLTDTLVRTVMDGIAPLHQGAPAASTTINEPVVSFVGRFADEYFHWFTDYLPCVLGLEAYEERTGDKPIILLPSDPPRWLTDSLAWVGIDSNRWIPYPGGRVHVERLIVPSMRRPAHDDDPNGWSVVSPNSLRELRDRMRAAIAVTPSSGERIYISRADSNERRVVNEDAVMDCLREHGFHRHVLTEYSLARQIRLFARASDVVGPHGAGLVNIMYGDDLSVIELFGRTVNPCYYSIATGLDFEYGYVQGDPVNEDIRVNIDDLEAVLAELIS